MNLPRKRVPSEVLRRGYSEEEIASIYQLGKLMLENGDARRAEAILFGLTEIAPEFAEGWLGLAYVHIQRKDYEAAISSGRQALKIDPNFAEAMLFLVTCMLTSGDFNAAGTYLGELGELIENGSVDNPNIVRLYRSQLARYQSRER